MSKKDRMKKKVVDLLDLPPDVVLDLPRVTLIGSIQLYIENHKGISLYEKNKICISVLNGELIVQGEDLHLRTVYNDDIYIEGTIKGISLEGCLK